STRDWSSDVCSSDLAWGEVLAGLLPGQHVRDMGSGKSFGPPQDQVQGSVKVTGSGGLSHIYFADRPTRMTQRELMSRHPDFMSEIGRASCRERGETV